MMCGRPRSTGAPSCAFWLDRATIDRLTALKIILLGPDPEARSAVLTLGSGGLLNARGWGAGTEEVRGSNPLSSTRWSAQIDVISYATG
jgi:hypothetical protein